MNNTQVKQLNKKIDKLLGVKKQPDLGELGMPIELIRKYYLISTKTLK